MTGNAKKTGTYHIVVPVPLAGETMPPANAC